MQDYYSILDVSPTASVDKIKEQYHLLLFAWHPDRYPDDQKAKAEAKTREIIEAYQVLSNPEARKAYDTQRQAEHTEEHRHQRGRAEEERQREEQPKQDDAKNRFVTFNCPHCGATIYQRVPQCMFCGTALTDEVIDSAAAAYQAGINVPGSFKPVKLAVGGFLLLALLLALFMHPTEKDGDQATKETRSSNTTRRESSVTPPPMQEARSSDVTLPPPSPASKAVGKPENSLIPEASVGLPNTKVGDTYIIEYLDPDNPKSRYSTERKVVAVGEGTITVASKSMNSKTAKARTLQFTSEWNLISSRNPDGSGFDYAPPLQYFAFPLYPGKTWQQTSQETNIKTGAVREHTLSVTVGDWEEVTVPAGTFRALKITLQTELLDRTTEQQSTGTDISWYAPNIRRSVKSEVISRNFQGQQERQIIQLMQYDLKEAQSPVQDGVAKASPAVKPAKVLDLDSVFIKGDKLSYAGYEIEKSYDHSNSTSFATIRKNGQTLVRLDKGNDWEDSTRIGLFSFLGTKTKQLIIMQYTGGAHCCFIYKIYDLDTDVRLIFDDEKYGILKIGSELQALDFDGQGKYDLVRRAMSFGYFHMPYAYAILPEVVFSYDEGTKQYVISNKKFSNYILRNIKDDIKKYKHNNTAKIDDKEFYLSSVLGVFLNYIYSGKEEEGWKFFNGGYKLSNKEEIRADIIKTLNNDPLYKGIYGKDELQGKSTVRNDKTQQQNDTRKEPVSPVQKPKNSGVHCFAASGDEFVDGQTIRETAADMGWTVGNVASIAAATVVSSKVMTYPGYIVDVCLREDGEELQIKMQSRARTAGQADWHLLPSTKSETGGHSQKTQGVRVQGSTDNTTQFEVAHIQEQGQDIIIVIVSPSFHSQDADTQMQIYTEIEACARSAQLGGGLVLVYNQGLRFAFYGPRLWHSFFQSVDKDWVASRINGKLTCY